MINGEVSHWWRRIGRPSPRPGLDGGLDADVVIVGGGYTGLWTAYYLKREAPQLRIAILEAEFCGYGASGRNGGWLTNAVTGGRAQYVRSHGREAAERLQAAFDETVDEVVRVAGREGIDADIVKGGNLEVAYAPAQLARLRAGYEADSAWPGRGLRWLEADEARERIAVDGMLGAVWSPHCARIQPAKLARGLAEAVERLGVELYEGTRVAEIRPHAAVTARGTARGAFVIRATEGFTAGLRGLRREWLPMNSSMIVTEPISPERWERIGWQGMETLGDEAHAYMYAQRTADGRIAFGGRGVPYRWGSRTDTDGVTQPVTAASLRALLERFFPVLRGVGIEHLWSGTLGVPRDWAAGVGLDRATGMGYAGGYVGTGVAATNLAGRTLRDLVLGRRTELTELPWVGHRVRRWEPEPLRWIATRLIYGAYRAADRAEYRGLGRTSRLAAFADLVSGRIHQR